jgi:hypothetical protein
MHRVFGLCNIAQDGAVFACRKMNASAVLGGGSPIAEIFGSTINVNDVASLLIPLHGTMEYEAGLITHQLCGTAIRDITSSTDKSFFWPRGSRDNGPGSAFNVGILESVSRSSGWRNALGSQDCWFCASSVPSCLCFAMMQDRLDDASQAPDRTAAPKACDSAMLRPGEPLDPSLVETAFAREHSDDSGQ